MTGDKPLTALFHQIHALCYWVVNLDAGSALHAVVDIYHRGS